jgi:hypothetical protein
MRDLQNPLLIQRLPEQLHSNRQLSSFIRFRETARHADSANPGEVRRDRENIRQIHS